MNGDNLDARAAPPTGTPDLSALLGSVLSNPNAMAMLSSLLGGVRSESPAVPEEAKKSEAEQAIPALLSLGGGKRAADRRENRDKALLCALKPYLSPPRRELVDRLIGILYVIELAGPLLGIEPRKRDTYNK